jgi:hypothetical protein
VGGEQAKQQIKYHVTISADNGKIMKGLMDWGTNRRIQRSEQARQID